MRCKVLSSFQFDDDRAFYEQITAVEADLLASKHDRDWKFSVHPQTALPEQHLHCSTVNRLEVPVAQFVVTIEEIPDDQAARTGMYQVSSNGKSIPFHPAHPGKALQTLAPLSGTASSNQRKENCFLSP